MSRFIIGALRAGHHVGAIGQLAQVLPLGGETVDILADTTGAGPWFYAVLDEPLKHHTPIGEDRDDEGPFTWATDVVFRSHQAGQEPYFGMQGFPVDLAVVLDPHMRDAAVVDVDRIDFIAVVEIDDADHEPTDTAVVGPAFEDERYDTAPDNPLSEAPAVFPEPDFPSESAVFPEPDFPSESAVFPEPDFPPESAETVDTPTMSPAPPLPLPEPLPAPELTLDEPPPPAAPRKTPPPRPRTTQVEELIAQAAATMDPPPTRPAPAPRAASPTIPIEPAPTRNKGPLVAAVVAGTLLILGGWGLSALHSRDSAEPQADSPSPPTTATTSTPPTSQPPAPSPKPQDFARLTGLLPPGYPRDACQPAATVEGGGIATLTCGPNDDPGGPPSGLYTVFPSRTALNEAFDRAVGASEQLICPGNIQSPGPWRRNASPQKPAGILFCGTRAQDPVIIWSDTERLLLSTVSSTPTGPSMDDIYAWWTTHS